MLEQTINCTALKINHKIVYVKSKKKWEICEVDADNIENDQ